MNKSIKPRNNKGQHHGLWEIYFDGKLMYKSFYHNGKPLGYEEWYCNSKIGIKTYYI